MTALRKGDVWLVDAAGDQYRVLVISSDMFNIDSGLGHVLSMEMRPEPGPYSFPAGVDEWHVWPAHVDPTPKSLCVERVDVVSQESVSEAHTRLFMMLHESSTPR